MRYLPAPWLSTIDMVSIKIVYFFAILFFFQAEDGIRDLVRSRGLGDVYKRQVRIQGLGQLYCGVDVGKGRPELVREGRDELSLEAVSYTHLTLPTIYSV